MKYVTIECIHTVTFHFYGVASLEIDLFKMGAKLGTLPLIILFTGTYKTRMPETAGPSITLNFDI
jgi:hypothetical protein